PLDLRRDPRDAGGTGPVPPGRHQFDATRSDERTPVRTGGTRGGGRPSRADPGRADAREHVPVPQSVAPGTPRAGPSGVPDVTPGLAHWQEHPAPLAAVSRLSPPVGVSSRRRGLGGGG